MKIAKQLILPVALIAAFSLYLGIKSTGKMNYKIPAFNVIDDQQIDTIEIDQSSGSLKLYSDNGIWKLGPDNLRANPSKIKEMLSFLTNPKFIDMVSDSSSYQNYGLDDKEYITVKAFINADDANTPDRELFIGDLSNNGNFTYIRRSDNSSVFTVKRDIRSIFDISAKDILDKRILDIAPPKIDKIELSFPDTNYTLKKTVGDNNEDTWNTSEGVSIESKNLDQSLRYLSNSIFDSYTDDEKDTAVNSIFKINLSGENLSSNFIILEKNDEGYYCESSFAGKSFILSENTGTQIIKMFSELIEIKEN